MPSEIYARAIVETPLVRVTDVCCRAPRSAASAEEYAASTRFVFPRQGVFEWHVRKMSVVSDANTVLLFSGGEPYRVTHPSDGGDDCTVVVFARSMLDEAIADARKYLILSAPLQRRAHLLLRALRASASDPLAADDAAMGLLETLAPDFQSASAASANRAPRSNSRRKRQEREAVEAVRKLIAMRPAENLTLEVLARGVYWSPFHLARRFRAITGTPVHQYRLAMRYALALERLTYGCDDLSALAVDLGFASHSHFSAGFKRGYGMTPERARAALRSGNARQLRDSNTE